MPHELAINGVGMGYYPGGSVLADLAASTTSSTSMYVCMYGKVQLESLKVCCCVGRNEDDRTFTLLGQAGLRGRPWAATLERPTGIPVELNGTTMSILFDEYKGNSDMSPI